MTESFPNAPPRIAFVASKTDSAQAALAALSARYPSVPVKEAELIVSLGGDGFMLHTLHRHAAERKITVFGMKLGTVGFLMNLYREDDLIERLMRAQHAVLHPLKMRVIGESASTALHPGSARAGSRMKWSSQISRSTRSGEVSAASSTWMRPDSDTSIAS